MNLSRKILVLVPMLFGLPAFANELTKDLQKACVSEQLRDHKGVSGHSLEASSFTEYCKCESNFIIGKATKEQLSEISQKPNTSPKWLKQIKSKAFKSCIEEKQQIIT